MGPNVRDYKVRIALRVVETKSRGTERTAAVSPDGRWVALGGVEFDIVDVVEKRVVGGNDDFDWSGDLVPIGGTSACECCFSPDGRRLAVVHAESDFLYWTMFDVEPSGKLSLRYQFERDAFAVSRAASTEAPTSVAFSPDGRLWATWICPSWSGRAVILEADTGKLVSFAFIHNDQLGDAPYTVDLVFDDDGSRLAVHTILGTLWMDVATGALLPVET